MTIRRLNVRDFDEVASAIQVYYASDSLLVHPEGVLARTLRDSMTGGIRLWIEDTISNQNLQKCCIGYDIIFLLKLEIFAVVAYNKMAMVIWRLPGITERRSRNTNGSLLPSVF